MHEAEEVGRCLAAGKLVRDILPLDQTPAIMRTLDTLRSWILPRTSVCRSLHL